MINIWLIAFIEHIGTSKHVHGKRPVDIFIVSIFDRKTGRMPLEYKCDDSLILLQQLGIYIRQIPKWNGMESIYEYVQMIQF